MYSNIISKLFRKKSNFWYKFTKKGLIENLADRSYGPFYNIPSQKYVFTKYQAEILNGVYFCIFRVKCTLHSSLH